MSDSDKPPSLRDLQEALEGVRQEVATTRDLVLQRSAKLSSFGQLEKEIGSLKTTFQTALEGNHERHERTHRDLGILGERLDERDDLLVGVIQELTAEMSAIRKLFTRKPKAAKPGEPRS